MDMNKIVRIILAILVGEIALALFTTIAQEVVFDGISFSSSPLSHLIIGGLLTVLAAVLAGVVARLISKNYYPVVPAIISLFIILETIWLITQVKTGDPVWFDIIAGLSLVGGIWGGYVLRTLQSRVSHLF